MIIDLTDWNEYITDDVPPGPIPENRPIEIIAITTATGYKKIAPDDFRIGFACGLQADSKSVKCRTFWRILK